MHHQSLNSALGWAPDRFLRLQGARQVVVAVGESIKPVFPELPTPARAPDAAQGQDIFGTQLAPKPAYRSFTAPVKAIDFDST